MPAPRTSQKRETQQPCPQQCDRARFRNGARVKRIVEVGQAPVYCAERSWAGTQCGLHVKSVLCARRQITRVCDETRRAETKAICRSDRAACSRSISTVVNASRSESRVREDAPVEGIAEEIVAERRSG